MNKYWTYPLFCFPKADRAGAERVINDLKDAINRAECKP